MLLYRWRCQFRFNKEKRSIKTSMKSLKKMASLKTLVLLCGEEDPTKCHRNLMITPDLIKLGFDVKHIRGDGSLIDGFIAPVPADPSVCIEIKDNPNHTQI
jgi:hypothetical protein